MFFASRQIKRCLCCFLITSKSNRTNCKLIYLQILSHIKEMADTAVESTPVAVAEEQDVAVEETPAVVPSAEETSAEVAADNNEADKSADLSASLTKEPLADATPIVVVEILDRVPATDENPATQTELEIIKQVEYYFSDANLARDKFLTGETKKDDGWVTLEVLLKFKRLLALSEDADVIVTALVKSSNDLLQISKDRLKVRRNPARPLPEQNEKTRQETIARTAYVKGFPLDTQMSDLIKFFDKYENITNVIMRRYQDKPTKEYGFKGSVFVSFATREGCAEFIALEKVEWADEKVLERKWESEYYEAKKAERSNDKKKGKKEEENKINLPKGAVIFLEGLSGETTRESIKEAISALGK